MYQNSVQVSKGGSILIVVYLLYMQARDHSNTEVARRYNCIAIFLNVTAVVTGIVIIGIIIAARFASQ